MAYGSIPIHLVRGGGEQNRPEFRAINPQGRLPALRLPSGDVLTQSPAILEWLEEVAPEPPLLPSDPVARARVRAVAALIGCDIHPLNNAAVITALRAVGQEEAEISAWIGRWIGDGFAAVERMIGDDGWCFGPHPGMADVYLIPQVFSARRFAVPLDAYPRISRVADMALHHSAFIQASPEAQPDSV